MKRVFGLVVLLFLTSCAVSDGEQEETYVQFSLNVHDWVFPEESAASLLKAIELHEKYAVPVDIFLDDQIFQLYVENYPGLVEKLKTSPVVAISYHVRPPMPIAPNFDRIGLSTLSDEDVYATVRAYEEHRLNLETGTYDEDAPGGYQFVKDMIDYAPYSVGSTGSGDIEKIVEQVYSEKGALFKVEHGNPRVLGEKSFFLYYKPEDKEIKWYEYLRKYMNGEITAEHIFEENMKNLEQGKSLFVVLKVHENNFYTDGTPFLSVYLDENNKPLDPPYDLSAGVENTQLKTEDETQALWELYEALLLYVSEHPERYALINNKGLKVLLEEKQ